jgi:hypothetical protein
MAILKQKFNINRLLRRIFVVMTLNEKMAVFVHFKVVNDLAQIGGILFDFESNEIIKILRLDVNAHDGKLNRKRSANHKGKKIKEFTVGKALYELRNFVGNHTWIVMNDNFFEENVIEFVEKNMHEPIKLKTLFPGDASCTVKSSNLFEYLSTRAIEVIKLNKRKWNIRCRSHYYALIIAATRGTDVNITEMSDIKRQTCENDKRLIELKTEHERKLAEHERKLAEYEKKLMEINMEYEKSFEKLDLELKLAKHDEILLSYGLEKNKNYVCPNILYSKDELEKELMFLETPVEMIKIICGYTYNPQFRQSEFYCTLYSQEHYTSYNKNQSIIFGKYAIELVDSIVYAINIYTLELFGYYDFKNVANCYLTQDRYKGIGWFTYEDRLFVKITWTVESIEYEIIIKQNGIEVINKPCSLKISSNDYEGIINKRIDIQTMIQTVKIMYGCRTKIRYFNKKSPNRIVAVIYDIENGDDSSDYLVEFDNDEEKVCDFYQLEYSFERSSGTLSNRIPEAKEIPEINSETEPVIVNIFSTEYRIIGNTLYCCFWYEGNNSIKNFFVYELHSS